MKKLITLLSMSSLVLLACDNGENAEVDNSNVDAENTQDATLVETEEESEETDEMLVTNGPLLEVGQYSMDDEFGRIELLNIASPNNEVEIASGILLTIEDVKIINFVDIPEDAIEEAEYWYGFNSNQGYDLQFAYSIENQNDYLIDNIAIERIILSNGEQIDRDFFYDESFTLEPESRVSNQVGHIAINDPDISSVRFYINPYHGETYEDIESSPIEVSFPE